MMESLPLGEKSPNIQETDVASRKRSHDEFASEDVVHLGPDQEPKRPLSTSIHPADASLLPPAHDRVHRDPSPQGSPALTEDGHSATTANSSPNTPSKAPTTMTSEQNTTSSVSNAQTAATTNPPAKKKRLTPAEKEAKEKEAAEKKEQREKEREEKRKKKEEEDRIRAQKAQEREDKKRKKEEEQRQIQEAKEKEARKQKKLSNFFAAPNTPKKAAASKQSTEKSPQKVSPSTSPSKPAKTEYQKRFHPFFLKEHTELAPPATQMDEETRSAKSAILDEFISGERTLEQPSFNAVESLTLPGKTKPRGRLHHPVKHIMENVFKDAGSSGSDEAHKVIAEARAKLRKVPIKVISFSQDVRPPYYGTITFQPFVLGKDQMRRLARRSQARRLPLDYEYDSEAEWQEEEGEDLDGDDDEEEIDEEDDMDGFLDDSEDAGPARRVFINTMEPESSGICFENEHRQGPNEGVYQHKLEFIIDHKDRSNGLDPWSTAYWEPELKPTSDRTTASAKMMPPPAPANAFVALTGAAPAAPIKVVKDDIMDDVKKAILDNKGLSKVGIIDVVFQQFRDQASRTEVKNTIELVAEKQGPGRVKEWVLKPEHGISA
ncbi:Chromatin assembly factor 1 subunit-like protein [Hapsidospora chrysogenum ATCC 11550]|uniref:Chromatin assembly factor 1 subunit-like protein n=1 Tax=Hapsidospora chrysogenum (strain ATCC 11550 / CBS 779.69 / DSM 880 / IAM 14645 / JCM 23072 / IMI 49137) TaxID=857340 RepID=A0A086TC80_HAPC1|nr:Chromatin assembly factor 1 subunit-like protein [Hapsidospora chrysogenum ATCC 11550]